MCNLVHNKTPLLPRTHRPRLLAYSTFFLLKESADSIRHRLDQRLKCPNCYRSPRPLKATFELINVLWLRIFVNAERLNTPQVLKPKDWPPNSPNLSPIENFGVL